MLGGLDNIAKQQLGFTDQEVERIKLFNNTAESFESIQTIIKVNLNTDLSCKVFKLVADNMFEKMKDITNLQHRTLKLLSNIPDQQRTPADKQLIKHFNEIIQLVKFSKNQLNRCLSETGPLRKCIMRSVSHKIHTCIELNNLLIQHYRTLLTQAEEAIIECKSTEEIRKILEEMKKSKININTLLDGRALLHCAAVASYNNTSVINLLVDYGADVNVAAYDFGYDSVTETGNTPLHFAAKNYRSTHCIIKLLECGAIIDSRNKAGRTALHVAAYLGHENILITLIEHEASLNIQDVHGKTPLHYAAEFSESEENVVITLVRLGASLDIPDHAKKTPLDYMINSLTKENPIYNQYHTLYKILTGDIIKLENIDYIKNALLNVQHIILSKPEKYNYSTKKNIEKLLETIEILSRDKVSKSEEDRETVQNYHHNQSTICFTIAVALSALIITVAFVTQTYIILAALVIPAMIGLYGYNEGQKPDSKLRENIELENISTFTREAGA